MSRVNFLGWDGRTIGERHFEHRQNRNRLFCFRELAYSKLHVVVRFTWLGAIRSKDSIPPRYVEPKIAIGFVTKNGVMDAMHVGSYQYETRIESIELGIRRLLWLKIAKR